jgi:hypothetical protein
MRELNGEEERPKENDNQQCHINMEHPTESISTTQVLETIRNLTV